MVSDMELVVSRMQVSEHILLQQLLPPLPFLDKIQPHLQILGIDGSFLVRAIQIKSEWPFFFLPLLSLSRAHISTLSVKIWLWLV